MHGHDFSRFPPCKKIPRLHSKGEVRGTTLFITCFIDNGMNRPELKDTRKPLRLGWHMYTASETSFIRTTQKRPSILLAPGSLSAGEPPSLLRGEIYSSFSTSFASAYFMGRKGVCQGKRVASSHFALKRLE